jgi:hypothetical protein
LDRPPVGLSIWVTLAILHDAVKERLAKLGRATELGGFGDGDGHCRGGGVNAAQARNEQGPMTNAQGPMANAHGLGARVGGWWRPVSAAGGRAKARAELARAGGFGGGSKTRWGIGGSGGRGSGFEVRGGRSPALGRGVGPRRGWASTARRSRVPGARKARQDASGAMRRGRAGPPRRLGGGGKLPP